MEKVQKEIQLLFQSTLPVWGATAFSRLTIKPENNFNPRSPCGEQQFPALYVCLILGFQSTLLVWGATSWCTRRGALPGDFNPRSPCGERPVCAGCSKILFDFNPRSPCGERHEAVEMVTERMEFQSTLPVWGATLCTLPVVKIAVISIHAPRVGSDGYYYSKFPRVCHFNPRSPCGERPQKCGWVL